MGNVIDLKIVYEKMINESTDNPEREINKLKILNPKPPVLLAGIDTITLDRQLYIDLGSEAWSQEQLMGLPTWRGLTVTVNYYEKLGLLEKHYFLILKQGSGQSAEIFEAVLQNLVDHLVTMREDELLFTCIYKVLDRWRNFFLRGGYRKLTEEQQRGLFGELWFIKEWMNRFPSVPPLLIEQWEGPTSGRIDFVNSQCGVEIKTAIERLTKSIKISSEQQLKLTQAINSIYIYVCFLESSKTHGISLQDLVNQVRDEIASRSTRLLVIFNDFITDLGFKEEEYRDVSFYVNDVEVYQADDRFPRIDGQQLPVGISHVSYNIDLTHCSRFQKEVDEIFEVF